MADAGGDGATGGVTTFVAVRHGQTPWNAARRLQGWTDTPLSDLGRRQAAHAAAAIAAAGPFASIVSSDLERAARTADIIATEGGLLPKDAAVATGTGSGGDEEEGALLAGIARKKELREHNLGVFQGCTWAEVEERFPEELARYGAEPWNGEFAPPEGESRLSKFARVTGVVESVAAEFPGKRVLLVVHGGVLRDLYLRTLDVESRGLARPQHAGNCSMTTFTVSNSDKPVWKMVSWADDAHLRDAGMATGGHSVLQPEKK